MHKLAPSEHHLALPIVERFGHALLVQGVVEGTLPGWVYVDRREEPRALLASIPGAHWLLGDTSNPAFNQALADLVAGQILPQGREAGWAVFNLHFAPDDWKGFLERVLADWVIVRNHQRFFRFRKRRIAWQARLSAGASIHRLDEELFGQDLGPNLGRLRDSLEQGYGTLSHFLEHGFGFCLVQDDEVVSWCTTDCVSRHRCEIGVYTDRRYRRRGLATAVVAATVDHCLATGLHEMGWHCWSQNLASAATALRAGFVEAGQHRAIHIWLNPVDGHLVNGNLALMQAAYREAAEHYDRAFALLGSPGGHAQHCLLDWKVSEATYRYLAACAQALAGDSEASLRHLDRALDAGSFRQAGY